MYKIAVLVVNNALQVLSAKTVHVSSRAPQDKQTVTTPASTSAAMSPTVVLVETNARRGSSAQVEHVFVQRDRLSAQVVVSCSQQIPTTAALVETNVLLAKSALLERVRCCAVSV
tara:strand:- start:1018 stop:1362 length:345 start_codon:yes stop_codon:yes gene_type:complete